MANQDQHWDKVNSFLWDNPTLWHKEPTHCCRDWGPSPQIRICSTNGISNLVTIWIQVALDNTNPKYPHQISLDLKPVKSSLSREEPNALYRTLAAPVLAHKQEPYGHRPNVYRPQAPASQAPLEAPGFALEYSLGNYRILQARDQIPKNIQAQSQELLELQRLRYHLLLLIRTSNKISMPGNLLRSRWLYASIQGQTIH